MLNNCEITSTAEIAENFNKFFASAGLQQQSSLKRTPPSSFQKYLNKNILTSMHFDLINEEQLQCHFNSLKSKSSSGHDGLSMRLVKDISPALLQPLCIIINQSLLTGIFPERLKIAKIYPLFKKGDSQLLNNYRPISILPVISKIFEKVVFKQLSKYFTENKLLFKGEYGFRPEYSTELANLEFSDRLFSNIDNKQIPIACFMDLSKAFDCLDHSILLRKLSYYGITGTSLLWFENAFR